MSDLVFVVVASVFSHSLFTLLSFQIIVSLSSLPLSLSLSLSFCWSQFLEGIVLYAFFLYDAGAAPKYAVTIMRYSLDPGAFTFSFFLSFLPHAICTNINVTHATINSNTICPIFNTKATRFLAWIFKRGFQTMNGKKNCVCVKPFSRFAIGIFKSVRYFFEPM